MPCWHGVLFLAWLWWLRAVSRLMCVVASHAVLTWRAGEGGGLILPALAKSAPTLPSPPRHPGTARCAACGIGDRNAGLLWLLGCIVFPVFCPLFFFSCVSPYSGAGVQGIARARGEPFRQSLLAVCGGRLTPCPGAERSNVSPNQQSEATSARISRARQRHPARTHQLTDRPRPQAKQSYLTHSHHRTQNQNGCAGCAGCAGNLLSCKSASTV